MTTENGKPLSNKKLNATSIRTALLGLLLIGSAFFIYLNESTVTVKKPFVYLIPDDFSGPVFVFFGQKDGVIANLDPMGMAVTIPKNGIVKIQTKVEDLIADPDEVSGNVVWVTVSPNGARKLMSLHHNTYKDDNGRLVNSYTDEAGKLHEFDVRKSGDPFFYLSSVQKNERMIFAHDGCKYQEFVKENSGMDSPDCAKFMVITPVGFSKIPNSLWDALGSPYESIAELEAGAATRVATIQRLQQ